MNLEFTFYSNGHTLCFNPKDGNQLPEYQVAWLELFFEFLEKKGIDPTESTFRLPGGRKAIPVKIKERWNWRIE